MTSTSDRFFGGLFDEASHRRESELVGWRFASPDSNTSAERLFERVDALLRAAQTKQHVFLHTIEADAEPGRFPDILVAYFNDETWDYTSRYNIAGMCKPERSEGYLVGRLILEARPGQLRRLLAQNGGIRWAANLALGGVQVSEECVAEALRLNPFDPDDAPRLQALSRLAWVASGNLDGLAVWCDDEALRRVLSRL